MITIRNLIAAFAEIEKAGQSGAGLVLDEELTATLCSFIGQHGNARSLVMAIHPTAYATYSGGGHMEATTHEIVARIGGKAALLGTGTTAAAAWAETLSKITAEENTAEKNTAAG